MKILIFEGISGSGKSTLIENLRSLDNYDVVQLHRFTPTQWVYDRLYNRREVDYEWFNNEFQKLIPVYMIWCYCSPQVALDRQRKKENDLTENLEKASNLYNEYFMTVGTWKNMLKLDTSKLSIKECIEEIKLSLK